MSLPFINPCAMRIVPSCSNQLLNRTLVHFAQAAFEGTAGKKKRRLQSGATQAGGAPVTLDDLVEGKSRLDACRWFFETLVLKSRDYIELEQAEPYGSITIQPRKLLAA